MTSGGEYRERLLASLRRGREEEDARGNRVEKYWWTNYIPLISRGHLFGTVKKASSLERTSLIMAAVVHEWEKQLRPTRQ